MENNELTNMIAEWVCTKYFVWKVYIFIMVIKLLITLISYNLLGACMFFEDIFLGHLCFI